MRYKIGELVLGYRDGLGYIIAYDEQSDEPYIVEYVTGTIESHFEENVKTLKEQLEVQIKHLNELG